MKGRQLKLDAFSYLGNVVTCNEKIQNEINEKLKTALQFYNLVKGLLRNNIKRNVNLIFLKFISIEYYYKEQKSGQTTKREDSKIQAKEMKFLRAILNKTKDRI